MRESNSALRAHLGACLKELQSSLSLFGAHICAEARDCWLWNPPGPSPAAFPPAAPELSRTHSLEAMAVGIQRIKYRHESQASHESEIFPGIVVLADAGLTLADDVNRWKEALAKVLRAMNGRTEMGVVDSRTGERGLRPLREVALEAFYFRRLNYWQATRRIEVLRREAGSGLPDYVGFMWATSRDVRRTSREELLEPGAEAAVARFSESELDILENLPAGEPLAVVRPGHTTPKVNIRWSAVGERAARTQVRLAVLPIVMSGDRLPLRLRKLPPAPTPANFRLSRIDTEVESQPLLQSLPVYRYLEHVRATKRSQIGRV